MTSSNSPTPPDHVIYRSPSNSSIASTSSGASLTRRPGIRARSRAGTTQKSSKKSSSDLPYLDKPCVEEPASYTSQAQHPRSPQQQDTLDARDLHGRASGSLQSKQSSEGAALDITIVADVQPSPMAVKLSKASEKAASLPDIIASYNSPSSTFFRDPCLTPVANVRDSVSTQQSATSSSVYPLSFSSATGPESPTSLRTMSEDIEHFEMPSYDPEVEDLPGFDPNDVSYRLRLLVKNNYFLPPAHSKPVLSNLSATEATKKQSRAATPTFLDIFRVNKSKSKPTSPTTEASILPMLRATGDSIMTPHRPPPRSSMQNSRPSPNGMAKERIGRVVVVREKMDDLTIAAKQAEQEIKTRGARRDHDSPVAEVHDDPIDPTDAVDIPPPSPSYPFPMQTSTLHGLGVSESVGAAVLAEHLPPGSPGLSSIDVVDDWRKALLQEAVHHSLDNTPDMSFSPILGVSTPISSLQGNDSRPGVTSPTAPPRILLQQRIIEQPFLDTSDNSFRGVRQERTAGNKATSSKSPTSAVPEHSSLGTRVSSRPSSYLLARVETPTDLVTALTPPPPRKQFNALISQSQTELSTPTKAGQLEREDGAATPTLRKTMSSPMLSDAYESDTRRTNRITPPPLPGPRSQARDSSHEHDTSGNTEPTHAISTDSVYSEDDYADRSSRQSAAMSALMRRPSLDYSQYSLSPTTSAFQEDLNRAHANSSTQSLAQASRQSTNARNSPVLRDSTMSPPPRISSSLAHIALPPPPRVSSLRHPPLPLTDNPHSQQSIKNSLDSMVEFLSPEPTTPTHATQNSNHNNLEAAVHSAPSPSSPTSFFDSIQSQPNALDDLDSSSDESDTVHPVIYSDVRSRTMSNVSSPTRSLLMRLGNHSTPYISRTAHSIEERRTPLPFGVQDPKQPIVNMPQRKPFFAQQKSGGRSDHGHGAPASSFDFYKYSKQHSRSPSTDLSEARRRPATAGETRPGGKKAKGRAANESLRRLDGLLQQHMEAEKDTIKRIAMTLQSSNNQGTRLS